MAPFLLQRKARYPRAAARARGCSHERLGRADHDGHEDPRERGKLSFETAVAQWDDGQRRLRDASPELRPALERVVDRIVAELRRRLGGSFTTDELVELYGRGTDWTLQVAVDAAPEQPDAWDAAVVADAAFARYVREAADYAGGRRRELSPGSG